MRNFYTARAGYVTCYLCGAQVLGLDHAHGAGACFDCTTSMRRCADCGSVPSITLFSNGTIEVEAQHGDGCPSWTPWNVA